MANKKGKKIAIWVVSVVVVLFLALLIAPIAFKGKIMEVVKKQINNNLTANVDFKDVNLSFIRNFPNARVSIENLNVIGRDSFALDTLVSAKSINAVINLKSLFSDTCYDIKKLIFNDVNVYAHVLPSGKTNWDIVKPDSLQEQTADTTAMKFSLKLKNVAMNNSNITYNDEQGAMKAILKKVNFSTSGDFTADSSLLKTKLAVGNLTFTMDKIDYLKNANLDIQADINANLNKMIFKLSKNQTKLNAIEFALNGFVQMLDPEGFDMDLTMNTEKVDFKSILSLIPAVYSKEFKDLKADGKVALAGNVKGKMAGESYPTFNFALGVEYGWLQYPQLPSKLQDINLNFTAKNATDKLETMILDLSKLSFNMGGNIFNASAHIEDPMGDPNINALAKGTLDLGKIKDFYPLEKGTNLSGVFNVDMNLAGRMSYYEKNQFDKFTFGGTMNVANANIKIADLQNDVSVSSAALQFTNQYANLTNLSAKIGKNDFAASGRLENFIGYALKDQTLTGNLTLNSNYLNLNDFMGESQTTAEESSPMTAVEIPKNLNFNMQASIKELIYDKMNFANAHGNFNVANGVLNFQNLGLEGFGGSVNVSGKYDSANPKKPLVNMDLALNNVAFAEVFKQVETFGKFAPIIENLVGNFSTKINLNSSLSENMMPDLATLLANGSLSTSAVKVKEVPALSSLLENIQKIPLAQSLKLPSSSNIDLKDLLLNFTVQDGKVNTKPFNVNIGGLKLNLGGASGLDQSLNWTGTATLPSSLNLGQFQNIGFTIGGTFTKPAIKLDLASTLNSVVSGLKDEATHKVTEVVSEKVQQVSAQALAEAQKQADNIRAQAKAAGDKLVSEAQAKGQQLVDAATNPIAKVAAQTAAKKLTDEAQKQAQTLYDTADKQATAVLEKAKNVTQ